MYDGQKDLIFLLSSYFWDRQANKSSGRDDDAATTFKKKNLF